MRKAIPTDVPRLVSLMEEFYGEAAFALSRQHAAEAFAALLADERVRRIWLIQSESRDVSHVIITFCFSMEYGGLIAFVDDLFVQRSFRRTGLATAALTEVRAFCAKHGVRALFVETGPNNLAAQALYRRVGFVNTERDLLALGLAVPTHADGDSSQNK